MWSYIVNPDLITGLEEELLKVLNICSVPALHGWIYCGRGVRGGGLKPP
jgi:hypothetical protein